MINVRCVILGGRGNWKITADTSGVPEDVVRLSFLTADFFNLSERDAYERVRAALRHEHAWIQPSREKWQIDLHQLAELIGRPAELPWLTGTVSLQPEVKSDSQAAANQRIANVEFVFYITVEAIAMTEVNEPKPMSRTHVFISYSHGDKSWLERLRVHLRPLVRDGLIDLFDDTKIKPGARWRDEIKQALEKARVAILLISADFLASDFIAEDELPPLLKKAQAGGATILPVIVSACRFRREKKLSEYQAVNDPQKPLANLTVAESEQVLSAVSEAVEEALDIDCSKMICSAPIEAEKAHSAPMSDSARELLSLIEKETDPNLKGLTEIRNSPEPGQTMFIASLATHGKATVYKMRSRLFREGIAELIDDKFLYPPENAGGSIRYEFRAEDRPPLAQPVVVKSDPAVSIPFAISVANEPTLVESPFSKGKYFDVSGFRHGDQVVDPYTAKICLVP